MISRLRNLKVLDDAQVTEEERKKALSMYGNLDMSVARNKYERYQLQRLEEQQKQRKIKKSKQVSDEST